MPIDAVTNGSALAFRTSLENTLRRDCAKVANLSLSVSSEMITANSSPPRRARRTCGEADVLQGAGNAAGGEGLLLQSVQSLLAVVGHDDRMAPFFEVPNRQALIDQSVFRQQDA